MSNDTLGAAPPPRKILGIKEPEKPDPSKKSLKKNKLRRLLDDEFTHAENPRYMVWREGGDAPEKIYDNPYHATRDARTLSDQEGVVFHVFRTWRISKPKPPT